MFLNKSVRLIPLAGFSPYENMAIDEFMIESYERNSRPVLRLYYWSPPGLSIGRNQDAQNEINLEKCAEKHLPIVRRITGGGAIYHSNELTYSIVCSENDLSETPVSVKASFEILNGFIMRMYSKFGLKAAYAKDIDPGAKFGERAPFCFAANEEYDVVIGSKKIGGNAQMRKKKTIFQHGSIPLCENAGATDFMRENTGTGNYTFLNALLGRKVDVAEAAANLAAAFIEEFNADLREEPLGMEEKKEVVGILTSRYALNNWNLKKMK
jgi:lipoate-protein ligase A